MKQDLATQLREAMEYPWCLHAVHRTKWVEETGVLQHDMGTRNDHILKRRRVATVAEDRDMVEIAGEIVRETDAAILFDDGTQKVWLPLSQIEINDDGTVSMPEWLAMEKELI